MEQPPAIPRITPPLVIHWLVLLGLLLTSLHSHLLFHSVTEISSSVIGFSIFLLAWNSRRLQDNDYFLFLGIAYLHVSGLDLLHTLAYKGMGVFPGRDANAPTQLWIAARYVQSLSLLTAPAFLRRTLAIPPVFLGYTTVTVLAVTAIFTGAFPPCVLEAGGPTLFHRISEPLIVVILFASLLALRSQRSTLDHKVLRWLVLSVVLAVGSELAFVFPISHSAVSDLVGHALKLIAFYLLYMAIVETGLRTPHDLLLKHLEQNAEALQDALIVLQRAVRTDPLTGLWNRGYFCELAEKEVQRAHRYHRPLSAVILNIDHLKRVNDVYGQAVGDHVLTSITDCCRQHVRGLDVLGRYGGDEIIILLPESDMETAVHVAERLRETIAQMTLNIPMGPTTVTASFGVAAIDSDSPALETLLARADRALQLAKQSGRNRVHHA